MGISGTIKKLSTEKGYGFVRDTAGREMFFHRSGVPNRGFDDLHEGDAVTFEEEASPKGPRATNVQRM